MHQTSVRLLRLLSRLQSRPFWRGRELAARMEATGRTVRRDVERLRSLGYPVDASAGTAGGYQLAAGGNLPPLLLDDDEALAVSLGLRLATGGTVQGMEEAALRAFAKLEQGMPARLRTRVRNLHAAVLPLGPEGPGVPYDRLVALAQACRSLQRQQFDYIDQDGRASRREAEPHALVSTEARWSLLAWDLLRGDWRTFRVDRIAGLPRAGERVLPRRVPGGDAAAFVSRHLDATLRCGRASSCMHHWRGCASASRPRSGTSPRWTRRAACWKPARSVLTCSATTSPCWAWTSP